MLRIAGTILLATVSTLALADTYVQGHFRKNGTYVQPHYRSSPNGTTLDNYSTQGNINPYTGKVGTKAPDTYNGPYVPPAYQPAQRSVAPAYGTTQGNGGTPSYGNPYAGKTAATPPLNPDLYTPQ